MEQNKKTSNLDPVEEIHRYREERAKSFNYDLEAMIEDLKQQEKKLGIKTIRLQPKTIKKAAS